MIFNINEKANKIIKQRKQNAENIALQNLLLARQNEEFLQNEKNENALIIEIAKNELNNQIDKKNRENLQKIQKNKEKILKNLKINLNVEYFCKKCKDTGVINNEICTCKKQVINEILKQESGMLNSLYSFDLSKKLEQDEQILFSKMQTWCEKFPNVKSKSIFLTGEIGVGKTFLCGAMANKLIEKNVFVYYTTAFALNNMFIDYCKTHNQEILNVLLDAEVLFIDDLGTEPILKNITLNYLYLILNERLVNNKAIVINSNLMPDEILVKYGERIFSRLMNKQTGLVLCYKGKDKRINNM